MYRRIYRRKIVENFGGQILDSVVVFLGGGRGHDFDGKTSHFADIGRRFCDSVEHSDGKWRFRTRVHTNRRHGPW